MRAFLLIVSLSFFATHASAKDCGSRRGSGWQLVTTDSQKCIGCGEVEKRCGTPATKKCVFVGCPNIHAIRTNCPEHLQPGLCPLK